MKTDLKKRIEDALLNVKTADQGLLHEYVEHILSVIIPRIEKDVDIAIHNQEISMVFSYRVAERPLTIQLKDVSDHVKSRLLEETNIDWTITFPDRKFITIGNHAIYPKL